MYRLATVGSSLVSSMSPLTADRCMHPGVIPDKGRPVTGDKGRSPRNVRSFAGDIAWPREFDPGSPVTEVRNLGLLQRHALWQLCEKIGDSVLRAEPPGTR